METPSIPVPEDCNQAESSKEQVSACSDCTLETNLLKSYDDSLLCPECYDNREISKLGHLSSTRRKQRGQEPTRKSARNVDKPRVLYSKQTSIDAKHEEHQHPKPNLVKPKRNYKLISRSPYAYSVPMVTDMTFYRGTYYQVGDIVGLRDIDDGKLYYAQLRGFLQDQYCEKSAVITWLLPSASSPEQGFDPATYFLGPEEDTPRKLQFMEFIMHAPSDYYLNRRAPYPTLTMKPEKGFIWTRLDSGITYKTDECKAIACEVPFTKVDPHGKVIEGDRKEDVAIAQDYKSPALLRKNSNPLDILARACDLIDNHAR